MAVNSELQAQSDAITGAIKHLETVVHQDLLIIGASLGALIIILCLVQLFKR